jgi:hypothetical protein
VKPECGNCEGVGTVRADDVDERARWPWGNVPCPSCKGAKRPELVSWRHTDKPSAYCVLVFWEDSEGEQRRTTLETDNDVDGVTFHYRAGDEFDPKDEDFADLIFTLEGDMAALRGSEFIPIRAWYYKPEKRA